MPPFEKEPAPEKKLDYTRQDEEKRQRALGRKYAIERGKVRKFDETMQQIHEGGEPPEGTAEDRRKSYYEGTVDKETLAEAARRKMLAGGDRPLKAFIADIMQERKPRQDDDNGFVSDRKKDAA